MSLVIRLFVFSFLLAAGGPPGHAQAAEIPRLPAWQVLEFEKRAFWATAHSKLELPQPAPGQEQWEFIASSTVPGNSEEVSLRFDPASAQLIERERLSRGKEDQRLKTYDYGDDHVLRERRNPGDNPDAAPRDWPVTSRKELSYPQSADELVLTNPYLLLLLAGRLQARGPGETMEVLVHTDLNFYRARLTSGEGIPLDTDFTISGQGATSGTRSTTAVALRITPEGELPDKDDFSLLGLNGEIIVLFDRESGLPLQVRGQAPRVGDTEINLKSATLRAAPP